MVKLESIERTKSNQKAFKATFKKPDGKTKTVRFGTPSNFVLNKDKTEKDKVNYKKRHSKNENWSDPMSAGSLSRHLLWGDSRELKTNISAFKNKFKI